MESFIFEYVVPFFSSYGYAIIWFAAFGESIPFLGMLVPGGSIVVVGGALAVDAGLSMPWLIFFCSLGAIMSDWLSFAIGRRYGEHILTKYGKHIGFKDEYLEVTHRFIDRFGGVALIIGRFNNIVRPLVPLVVGSTKMPYWKFWIFNIIGGIIWSIVSLYTGYIARESWDIVQGYVGIGGGIIFACIVIGVVLFIRYEVEQLRTQKIREQHKKFIEKLRKTPEQILQNITKRTKSFRKKMKTQKKENQNTPKTH